jgi:hypothetical protein
MSLSFGPQGNSELHAAGGEASREEEMARAQHHREGKEALEELRANGTVKQPWYRRLFRRSSPRD